MGQPQLHFFTIQCLQQLALEEKENFPEASSVVFKDFYVADLVTGTDSINEAKNTNQLVTLFSREGFVL